MDMDAMERRAQSLAAIHPHAGRVADDVRDLVAEVKKLRTELRHAADGFVEPPAHAEPLACYVEGLGDVLVCGCEERR